MKKLVEDVRAFNAKYKADLEKNNGYDTRIFKGFETFLNSFQEQISKYANNLSYSICKEQLSKAISLIEIIFKTQ